MTEPKLSLGQAIDRVIDALELLDADARKTAIQTACAHLKIPLGAPSVRPSPDPAPSQPSERSEHPSAEAPPASSPASRQHDIRSLRTEKSPRSAREMACVVAFYLQELAPEGERKDSVSTADLEKYFKQAKYELPGKIAQILPDAKRAGYFDSAATGTYKLNAVGYNLVAHKLPRQASA